AKMPPLNDWYPPAVGILPIEIARIVCQRENCQWDGSQRLRYAQVRTGIVAAVLGAVVVLGFVRHLVILDWATAVFLPLAPLVVLGLKESRDNFESAERLDELKAHALRLWDQAMHRSTPHALTTGARALQDEIFDSRRRSPLVFDWVFRLLRAGHED